MSSIEEGLFRRRAEAWTVALRDNRARNTGLAWAMVGSFMLLLAAVRVYPGSTVTYLLFSVAFLLLLFSAFYRQRTYGYTFLAVFLWLGFWLKVSWHLAWGTGFPEPTGQFTGSPSHWDHALLVSTTGALAVLSARLVFQFFTGSRQVLRSAEGEPPRWLMAIRAWNWTLFLLAVVAVAIANFHFQIFVIGLKVGTVLPWPLNALITLMLVGGGFAAWISILLGLFVDTLPDDGLARCGPAIFRVPDVHSDPKSAPVRQYRLVAERVVCTLWRRP